MTKRNEEYLIRPARFSDSDQLTKLVAMFRVTLARLRDVERELDYVSARDELGGYQQKKFPIFVAEVENRLVGYLVCRVEEDVVWAESLFVEPEYRQRGIASALYDQAEELAVELGSDTVYNWIHPNNHAIIALLRSKGYDVLNLVEVRKQRPQEEIKGIVQVGEKDFRY